MKALRLDGGRAKDIETSLQNPSDDNVVAHEFEVCIKEGKLTMANEIEGFGNPKPAPLIDSGELGRQLTKLIDNVDRRKMLSVPATSDHAWIDGWNAAISAAGSKVIELAREAEGKTT